MFAWPSTLKKWVNVNSALYIFTESQVANFPLSHPVAGGWYLDFSCGFVPIEERALYDIIISGALDEIIQSPTDPSELVNCFEPPPPLFSLCLLHDCVPNSSVHIFCRPASCSSRSSCRINPFSVSVPQTLRRWVTISKEMVGQQCHRGEQTNALDRCS